MESPKIIEKLMAVAHKSGHFRYRHAAALIADNGEIICFAANDQRGHAEQRCIEKYVRLPDHRLQGASGRIHHMTVIRLSNSGKAISMSRPCYHCGVILAEFKIPVIYSSVGPAGPLLMEQF